MQHEISKRSCHGLLQRLGGSNGVISIVGRGARLGSQGYDGGVSRGVSLVAAGAGVASSTSFQLLPSYRGGSITRPEGVLGMLGSLRSTALTLAGAPRGLGVGSSSLRLSSSSELSAVAKRRSED